ncbi:TPA: DNA polymerase IV [Aeromonas sobria]|uniref:DNA polymerase IV n=1 Tax=Aeromonas sobria TaxID=646 RepID=A0A2N3J5R5_AERSO|nr:DNA polymerase IV [Aeromonas sobria]ELM3617272.1 DNA polymerase IV [Aeromonas sobria]PKQ81721.1 DNA polymerase IV [Aeromonas sobria]HEH9400519.1 DNA polymerase IV [Aeromonas sobria]HEH9427783.1 DNA polymerase IV [Aeromonas sobria]
MRKIIHIDMDCFFAAVEMRDNPSLREVPLAIGGASERRGVISTCNYVARRFGVRSAMPSALAKKLCPPLVLIPGRMAVYKDISRQLRAIFLRYTDLVEPLSLDEAYLDVTHSTCCGGSATLMAQEIRQAIVSELGLTASAGVAPNKFLAKIASEQRKPDGLFVIRPDEVAQFVCQLPLGKLPGVGRKTAERLEAQGLYTCEDARALPADELCRRFGKLGEMLTSRIWGLDEQPVQAHRIRKTIGVETTLASDLSNEEACLTVLQQLLPELERRFQAACCAEQVMGQGIKIKFADFHQTTVYRSQGGYQASLFIPLLKEGLLRAEGRSVRLLGLVVGLPKEGEVNQLSLDLL